MATKRIKPTPVTGRAECEQLIDELARKREQPLAWQHFHAAYRMVGD